MKHKSTEYLFKDIAKFRYGKMPKKDKVLDIGKYPVYSGYRYVGYYDEYNTEAGQLIVVARGVGGTGDVKLTKEKCFLTNLSIAVEITANDVVIPEYLYYMFSLNNLRYLDSGSAQSQITISDLERLKITLPDVSVQCEIVSILKALDDKIALNQQINKNLEEQAQAIYKAWFVDFEPWHGDRPNSWEEGVLGDYVEIKRGGSPRPIQDYLVDSGLRWLKISDVTALQSPFIIDIKEHIKEDGLNKTVFLKAGALVLSNSATPGIPKILDVDSCIHDGWLYFPKSKLSNEFLYLLFKFIRKDLVQLGNGSVFTNLKTDILKNYPFSMPANNTLSMFGDIVTPLFQSMNNIARENKRLSNLRDALLPRLMSGEIDVSGIEL